MMRPTISPSPRRFLSTPLLLLAALVLAPLVTGCADDESSATHDLMLRVFNSSTANGEGFPPSIASEILEVRVRVYQNGQERADLTQVFDFRDPSGRLSTLEFGQNYQIVVEALGEDPSRPLADGATPVFDYLSSAPIREIQVFTSERESVEYASALFTAGNQVVSLPSEFEGWFVAQSRGEPRDVYGGQRAGHTLTPLPDGRIVAIGGARLTDAGGIGQSPVAELVDTVEIYDPFTGYWTLVLNNDVDLAEGEEAPAMRLSEPRAFHTATLIDDERIMVVGGFEASQSSLAASSRAEIIDVNKGTIEVLDHQLTDLFDPRALHTAHWVGGQLYVIGGVGRFYDSPTYLASVEVYDAEEGRFMRAIDPETGGELRLLEGRGMHTSHTLVDGVLVMAGRVEEGVTNTLEFLELREGGLHRFFDELGTLPRLEQPRFGHESVLMRPDFESGAEGAPRQYIAVAGGYTAVGEGADTLRGTVLTDLIEFVDERNFERQDGQDGRRQLRQNMTTARAHFSMVETTITNDLLVLGGMTSSGVTRGVERFLRSEQGGFPLQARSFGQLKKGRTLAPAVPLATHNIMIVGGWEGGSDASHCGDVLNAGCTSELANPGDLFFLGYLY